MWLLGMVEAIIEDLVIPTVLRGYLTQSDGDAVLSTTLPRNTICMQEREQRIKESDGCLGAEFSAAEKSGKGMTLKIFT